MRNKPKSLAGAVKTKTNANFLSQMHELINSSDLLKGMKHEYREVVKITKQNIVLSYKGKL